MKARLENQEIHPHPEEMTLRAILFHNENQWSLWIGDQVIHPENVHELNGFQIDKVTPTEVTLSKVEKEGEILKTFTLHPYPLKISTVSNPAGELFSYDLQKHVDQKR